MKNAQQEPAQSSEIECCPNCNVSLEGDLIRETEGYDEQKAEEYYGSKDARWCRKIGIEDPTLYDGVAWWQCPDCNHRWNRFSDSWYD